MERRSKWYVRACDAKRGYVGKTMIHNSMEYVHLNDRYMEDFT